VSTKQSNPRLLRCADAAAYLSTSKKTIRALIAKGELRYVQLGDGANSPFLLDVRDLDRLLEARKTRL
jgi:excisionase family DNA binding protein